MKKSNWNYSRLALIFGSFLYIQGAIADPGSQSPAVASSMTGAALLGASELYGQLPSHRHEDGYSNDMLQRELKRREIEHAREDIIKAARSGISFSY